MTEHPAPWHAHVYVGEGEHAAGDALRRDLLDALRCGDPPGLVGVGRLAPSAVGPHPKPQFEVQFHPPADAFLRHRIESSGLTALIHPLTDDDLADHTTLAHWIGEPLKLDLTVLDPPGVNRGLGRFGKGDRES